MIERHVTFEVPPVHAEDFERLFIEEYRPAMATMAGFQRVELLRDQENPDLYHMVIRFDSAEDAAAWRASDTHKALQTRIKTLYSASQLTVYNVVA